MVRYCPAGDGAFEDWVEHCPECGLNLEERSASQTTTEPVRDQQDDTEPVVFLATAPNEPMAHLWRDVLNDEGIRSLAKAAGPGIGGWGTAFGMEHDLFVLESDLARSREILADLEHDGEQMAEANDEITL
ncbi:MAG: DUF2007 domain-containing protein [Chloroflexota bacterium]|nr:DUF2007 domain-containing protein [Chloroflexota bacterium]